MGAPILRPRDILAIIELIYFVPVLVSGLIVCYRHGFSKQMGWLSIVVLACFRIGASSTWIAASYHDTSNGLVVASIILQSFGVASILIAIQGLLHRLLVTPPASFLANLPLTLCPCAVTSPCLITYASHEESSDSLNF